MKPSVAAGIAVITAWIVGAGSLWAESLESPTHQEVEPIRFDIGADGRLKTIAMDSQGNLLVGVSFVPAKGAAQPAAGATPGPRQSSADPQTTLARIQEAIRANSPEGWEKLTQEVTSGDFHAAMSDVDREIRRDTMRRLPQAVRGQWMRGAVNPDGARNMRDMYPGSRGGISPELTTDQSGHAYALKVVSPEGIVVATWAMTDGLQPKMIFGSPDGVVYVAGGGRLAQFSADGKLMKMVDTDQIYGKKAVASGLCADDRHVFLALGMGNSTRATEDFFRFKRDLTEPKMIIERQFGCCSHIDLRVANGELLIAENSRHRVNRFDFDGKPLGTWGRRDRTGLEGFTACCNPCNFDLGPGGVLYTAESGVGRVKKYTPDGKFLGLVGYVDTTKFDGGSQLAAQSCYIPMEVNHDASRLYVMDVRAHIIRVLAKSH